MKFEDYYKDILSLARILDYNNADDLTQEVYLRLYEKSSLPTIKNKKGYLLGILYNTYKEYTRQGLKYGILGSSSLEGFINPKDIWNFREKLARVTERVKSRDLVALTLVQKGLEEEAIAELMGINKKSVYPMAQRAEKTILEEWHK